MRVTPLSVSFESVYRKLVVDYLKNSTQLEEFITAFPSVESIKEAASRKQFPLTQREQLVAEIKSQYAGLQLSDEVTTSLEKLGFDSSRTITTGHQLNLFTGPSFMITKICNAIGLTRQMNDQDQGHSYVPVFWMATEDHDFEEINHTYIHGNKVGWESNQQGAVGRFKLDDLEDVIAQARTLLGTGFDQNLWSVLEKAYQQPDLAKATRYFVNELFGSYGLLVVDGDSPALKQMFSKQITEELSEQKAEKSISASCQKLKAFGYKIQANPRAVNGFFLEENARKRIDFENGQLRVIDGDIETDTILESISNNPEKFSPNAVFRPLYQESILPNVVYVGGAGEISYWLELKSMFGEFGVEFPVLMVRNSIWVLNPTMSKKLDKLGLSAEFFFGDIEPKKKQLVAERAGFDLKNELTTLEALFQDVKSRMALIDHSLERAVEGEKTRAVKGLSQLEKKAVSRLKAAHDTDMARIDALSSKLFPSGIPQERRENIFALTPSLKEHVSALIEHCNPLESQFYTLETEVS